MKKLFCDRCNEEIEKYYCMPNTTLQLSSWDQDTSFWMPHDLCITCMNELRNWLKGEPIPKQTTT